MKKLKLGLMALFVVAGTFGIGFTISKIAKADYMPPARSEAQLLNYDHQAAAVPSAADVQDVERTESMEMEQHIQLRLEEIQSSAEGAAGPGDPSSGYIIAQTDTTGASGGGAAPADSSTGIDKATTKLDALTDVVTSRAGVITIILGLLLGIAKAVSNEKAGPVVKALQELGDHIPSFLTALMKLLTAITGVISSAAKSDGLGGKK